jgi:hypothetical protein
MLLVHLLPSIVSETHSSRIPKMQEENVVEHHHALTINESAESHLATALEGHFIGNCGKHPQLDLVEESRVPEVCLLQCPHGNSKVDTFHIFFNHQEAIEQN